MEIQNDLTFDTMLQFDSFFLKNVSLDRDISKYPLPCMGKVCMLIISHVIILEGISTIQIWLMIQAKQQFHDDPWLILSGFPALHGTVHVDIGHASFICNFSLCLIFP